MTIEEFSKTRFGANMKVKILCSGVEKCIYAVDFETNSIGVSFFGQTPDSLDDLCWYKYDEVELVEK